MLFLKDMGIGFRTKAEDTILGTLMNKATLQSPYRINSKIGSHISYAILGVYRIKSN